VWCQFPEQLRAARSNSGVRVACEYRVIL
jgi:hypothetical protein